MGHDSIYRWVSPVTPDAKVRQQSPELVQSVTATADENGGADHVQYVYVFLRSIMIGLLYKLILLDQAHATLQLSVSLSDSVQKIFSRSALAGESQKCFSPGPEPALGGPGYDKIRPLP